MDSVVVLADGGKVAFTASLRGAETDIVPGDTIKRRIVGYLGHDGKTGCGAIFTNVRVVCCNTLAAALNSNNKVSVHHKGGANANFDALISSIDVARQTFAQEADLMREFARVSMGTEVFNEYLDEVYKIEEGQKFRKRDKLNAAFRLVWVLTMHLSLCGMQSMLSPRSRLLLAIRLLLAHVVSLPELTLDKDCKSAIVLSK